MHSNYSYTALNHLFMEDDSTAESRKQDHIQLALKSQIASALLDDRFSYEPLLAGHPNEMTQPFLFLGKTFNAPFWVSSMTGGTALARKINQNLARMCAEFGFGMGLGSCRTLLYGDETLTDFDVREMLGNERALYANLGIAQVEKLLREQKLGLISVMLDKLRADGLIIHVNPLQEWLQPEGDFIQNPPIDTIEAVLEKLDMKIIVKEVGSGMGESSLRRLFQLPIEAVDFAANGGTNFALVELNRSNEMERQQNQCLAKVGHDADEMVRLTNGVLESLGERALCKQVIVSGGVNSFLDGYYHVSRLGVPAIFGQAAAFLKYAREDYDQLAHYAKGMLRGYRFAESFLKIKDLKV